MNGMSGVAQGVLVDDDRLLQPLGPGRAHVVLAQHVQHGRAEEAAPRGHRDEGQHCDRHDQVQEVVQRRPRLNLGQPTGDLVGAHRRLQAGRQRRPPRPHILDASGEDGKDEDEEQAEEKRRHRRAHEGQRGEGKVELRILADGAVDTQGNSDDDRQDQVNELQLDRCRQAAADQSRRPAGRAAPRSTCQNRRTGCPGCS